MTHVRQFLITIAIFNLFIYDPADAEILTYLLMPFRSLGA